MLLVFLLEVGGELVQKLVEVTSHNLVNVLQMPLDSSFENEP